MLLLQHEVTPQSTRIPQIALLPFLCRFSMTMNQSVVVSRMMILLVVVDRLVVLVHLDRGVLMTPVPRVLVHQVPVIRIPVLPILDHPIRDRQVAVETDDE